MNHDAFEAELEAAGEQSVRQKFAARRDYVLQWLERKAQDRSDALDAEPATAASRAATAAERATSVAKEALAVSQRAADAAESQASTARWALYTAIGAILIAAISAAPAIITWLTVGRG